MAGRGPAPKDPARRARRNADPVPGTTLEFRKGERPGLPALQPNGEPWPQATVDWWEAWGESAQADHMTATDWSFLLDTAVLHALLWYGDKAVAGELRLRVAKFGATMEDRARLRITFASADQADEGRGRSGAGAGRNRYGNLRVLRPTADEAPDDGGDDVARS